MQIIDPHIHLFATELGHYQWLSAKNPPFWPDKAVINRDFNADDLKLSEPLQHGGFVHIEAGFDNYQPWRELAWLEASQSANFKSVASVDLTICSADFSTQIEQLVTHSSLVGVRHILDQNALSLLANRQVRCNLQHIADHGLIFECQLDATDSPAIGQLESVLLDLPQLTLVINHAGFPPINQSNFSTWRTNIAKLAAFSNLSIKASGWEMLDRNYQSTDIQLIIDILLELFSVNNIMLASNFPLCTFSNSYAGLWQTYYNLQLSTAQKNALLHDNAKRFYRL
ncbi:MAG: hypothetical protein OFPI_32470 [Osedax symbiont Rs2]|nr:MAG: hypothetical protein OFPI_32470 [Osedax symbiont Rs2]